jgi:hypothetical protein
MKRMFLRKSPRNTIPSNGQPVNAQDTPATPNDPATRIRKTRDRAIGYGDELIHTLSADLREGEDANLPAILELLPFYVDVVATADTAVRLADSPAQRPCEGLIPSTPDYLISSRFLHRCYSFLMGDSQGRERLHLVTGLRLGENSYTLDTMEKVTLSHQSIGGAKADQQALTRALIDLDTFGHHLLGLFHRHPASGISATHPSHIDLDTHKRMENGGYPVIGCIFVQDGYLRFFQSTKQLFGIRIYGKGVEKVSGEHHVYRIHNPESARVVSYETLETEQGGRGDR